MEVWELELYFYSSAGGLKKKKCVNGVNNGVRNDMRDNASCEFPMSVDVIAVFS